MSEQASQEAKSEDKKDIEVEERERMLNEENKNQDKIKEVESETVKVDIKEGMEVKPKKIPIGGIQMPGFFTRSKSKEKCKVCCFVLFFCLLLQCLIDCMFGSLKAAIGCLFCKAFVFC